MKYRFGEILKQPKKGFSELYWKTFGYFHVLPFQLQQDHQYDRIHEDLEEEDKYLLIILDACRFDYFAEEVKRYFDGEPDQVFSSGRDTFEYVSNTWKGNHKDIYYVSGAVPVNSGASQKAVEGHEMYQGYRPGDHLDIQDVWLTDWDDELGTVPPEKVREEAVKAVEDKDKVVAHFFQPHSPYIGDSEILGFTGGGFGAGVCNPADELIWKQFEKGEISEKELRKAYRSNLQRALKEVKQLVAEAEDDRHVVITGDHGELLGESGLQHHPRTNHPYLRLVPWMEVCEDSE